jgi:hypothetical protein
MCHFSGAKNRTFYRPWIFMGHLSKISRQFRPFKLTMPCCHRLAGHMMVRLDACQAQVRASKFADMFKLE